MKYLIYQFKYLFVSVHEISQTAKYIAKVIHRLSTSEIYSI